MSAEWLQRRVTRRNVIKGAAVAGGVAAGGAGLAFGIPAAGEIHDNLHKPWQPKPADLLPEGYSYNGTDYTFRVRIEIDGSSYLIGYTNQKPELVGDTGTIIKVKDLYAPRAL